MKPCVFFPEVFVLTEVNVEYEDVPRSRGDLVWTTSLTVIDSEEGETLVQRIQWDLRLR